MHTVPVFLDAIREFVGTGEQRAVLLLGAGLSSYPYLFDNDALWFEADLPPMVPLQRETWRNWRNKKS